MTYPSFGSVAVPPQFTEPMLPGYSTAVFGGAPGARYGYVVYGPRLYMPPLFSTTSWHAFACSGVVSSAVTMSSILKLCFDSSGGFSGIGCVGEVSSPGTSLLGTGRSSTPNTGLPVTRSRMNINAVLLWVVTGGGGFGAF